MPTSIPKDEMREGLLASRPANDYHVDRSIEMRERPASPFSRSHDSDSPALVNTEMADVAAGEGSPYVRASTASSGSPSGSFVSRTGGAAQAHEEALLDSILVVDDDLLDITFESEEDEERVASITCQPTNLAKIKQAVTSAEFEVKDADIIYSPTQMITVESEHEVSP